MQKAVTISKRTSALAAATVAVLALPAAVQATIYWDTNKTGTGAVTGSTAAAGIWSSSISNWGTSGGTTSTLVYSGTATDTTNGVVAFSAGTNASGTFNVTVDGAIGVYSMTFEEGAITLVGGSSPGLTLGAGGVTINSTTSGTTSIASSIGTLAISTSGNTTWTNNSNFASSIAAGIALQTKSLTFGGTNNTTVSGIISGSGATLPGILVSGGVVTFTNANTYGDGTAVNTFTTTVQAGTTLLVNNSSGSGTGARSVEIDGTLGGTGSLAGPTYISDAAILTPGAPGGTESLAFGDLLTLQGTTSKVIFDINGTARGATSSGYDAIDVTGKLTYAGLVSLQASSVISNGVYDLFAFGSKAGSLSGISFAAGSFYTASFTNNGTGLWSATTGGKIFSFAENSGDLTVSSTPEPASLITFAALVGLTLSHRRRSV